MAKAGQIGPCLWFDGQAEEAARYYTGIFKNSKMGKVAHYSEAGQDVHKQRPGSVLTAEFELNGVPFLALNGGPDFKFTEAVSLVVTCKDQKEVDYYWEKLTQGGDPKAQQCGWLKDKYGVSWQIVPEVLSKMISDSDAQKSGRVMEAIMPMKKIDVAALERAYGSEPSLSSR